MTILFKSHTLLMKCIVARYFIFTQYEYVPFEEMTPTPQYGEYS
jgi:hypothetical protein